MKRQGFAGILRRKQYVIAGAVIVVAAVGMTVLYSSEQERARRQLESEIAEELNQQEPEDMAAAEDTEEDAAEASAILPPKTNEEPKPAQVAEEPLTEETEETEETERAKETAAAVESLHFSPEEGFLWPLEGNVILNYSMDATVYFPTLDQYKYNPAVIIDGEVNDKVYSIAKGKVTDLSVNEETGCTMTLDLGDGYQAVYGQIKEPNYAVGDYVDSGQVLGFVAEPTKYYAVEGSNLYFELVKDGAPIDPVQYFE